MQNSNLYLSTQMNVCEWFGLINKIEEDATHIYQIEASHTFSFNNSEQVPGLYYLRASKELAESLNSDVCKVCKLSFSEIVSICDYNSNFLLREITPLKIEGWFDQGNVSIQLDDFANSHFTVGLKKMRDRVKVKYFDQGMKGVVLSFFSAISNFFRKYTLCLCTGIYDTGIYWPGNSSSYADKLIKKIQEGVDGALDFAINRNAKLISELLEISLEELKKMDFQQIKKRKNAKLRTLHPDKNQDLNDGEMCRRINSAFQDFTNLLQWRGVIKTAT